MNDPRGSRWRKWDLHVHTPDSLVQHYGAGGTDPWQSYLTALEALPPEIKVLGINDYIFVDGYKRVRAAKTAGRLANLDLILPVLELRLDRFAGTDTHLQRVNFHVIFSDRLDPDTIQHQFINALSSKYTLTSPHASPQTIWKGVPTKQSLSDLGVNLAATLPAGQIPPPNMTLYGFSNLALSLDGILDALNSPYFVDQYITAVGKTEWAHVQWNQNSIADKRNIINSAQLVFISSPDPQHWATARDSLRTARVNDRLLDCSDAHYYATSSEKNRLGHCFTWIKADPTFNGLKQAITEFDARVFVGDLPPKLKHVNENRTKYISSIEIRKTAGSQLNEVWFDVSLPFNHDLIAIIGNKGNGKSALADIVGLLGNTQRADFFSFLNGNRFRQTRDNKARDFVATATWESGTHTSIRLDENPQAQAIEQVKYIPQNFLETICNEGSGEGRTAFDDELESVIFSHVADADRLGYTSLQDLVTHKTKETLDSIGLLRAELRRVNLDIEALEKRNTPEHRLHLQAQLTAKQAELASHDAARPPDVSKPAADAASQLAILELTSAIEEARRGRDSLTLEIQSFAGEQASRARIISAADKLLARLANFRRQYGALKTESLEDLSLLGVDLDSLITVTIHTTPIDSLRASASYRKDELDKLLASSGIDSLYAKRDQIDLHIEALQRRLDEPNRRYQQYLVALQRWTERRDAIIGDKSAAGSLRFIENQIVELAVLPTEIAAVAHRRRSKVSEIYAQIARLSATYRELYRPVQEFIENHPIAKEKLQLRFEVSIVNVNFAELFTEQINHSVVGSFAGIEEGHRLIQRLLAEHDFNREDDLFDFIGVVLEHLARDQRMNPPQEVPIASQLKRGFSVQSIYELLFSLDYLRPRYVLKLGGRELYQLSPGEKGSLLLIFYLLVDKTDVPLVIDQPEENLDNHTIYDLLVPSIKEAKRARQIFMVTHNPNLAVVCDAEQIVHASIDKAQRYRVEYRTGAIESPLLNKSAVDVLEGTRPAFSNRESKYFAQ